MIGQKEEGQRCIYVCMHVNGCFAEQSEDGQGEESAPFYRLIAKLVVGPVL